MLRVYIRALPAEIPAVFTFHMIGAFPAEVIAFTVKIIAFFFLISNARAFAQNFPATQRQYHDRNQKYNR